MKHEIKVTFKTITPLWTGDAWQGNREIRPSAIIGSLRFWFEVICYFSGICSGEDFNNQLGRFEKEVDREKLKKYIKENGINISKIIEYLHKKQKIPLPSIIFGTTNWKSLIKIKRINYLEDYCFGNKLNLPYAIDIKKDNYNIEKFDTEEKWKEKINVYAGENFREKLKEAKKEYSFFFFSNPYFYGKFEAIFEVEESILETTFYPLLTFMDKYGYWGGKWNIGYGRLKVIKLEINNQELNNFKKENFELNGIKFNWMDLIQENNLDINDFSYKYLKQILNTDSFFCKNERDFSNKISHIPKKIIVLKLKNIRDNDFYKIIEQLLNKKIELRDCLRPYQNNNQWANFRHKLFGELREGSKILPYIYEEENQLKGGFLSVAGLLNL